MNTVRTNNVPRDVLDACDLTTREREDFDYLDWPKIDAGEDSAAFFRYRGHVYDLGEFLAPNLVADDPRAGWHGFSADTYFSATLVRFVDDGERIIVGRISC
jgi:hypothetical protein